MIFAGDVVLPDGRIVHGVVKASTEWDTNTLNIHSVIIEWKDGDALTGDEFNEDLGCIYLHEYVTDRLCERAPEYEDDL